MKSPGTDDILSKGIRTTLFVAVIALPLSTIICNAALIVTFVLSLVAGIRSRNFTLNLGVLPVIIFVLYILSFLYSQNMTAAVHSLELNASYLFIPFIFGFAGALITDTFRNRLLVAFTISVLLVSIGSYLIVAFKSGQLLPSNTGKFSYVDPFSRMLFSEVTNIHPSYLSVYLLFSMVILIEKFKMNNYVKVIVIVIMFLIMLILSAKNQIVLFFLVLSVLIWNHIHVPVKFKILIIIVTVLASMAIGLSSDQVRYRFKDEITETLGDRVILWSAGWEIISDNPVLGVGAGDTDDSVNEILVRSKSDWLFNFNLHNQYLDYWLMLGITGMVLFIIIVVAPLRYGDMMFRIFAGIMALSMVTESMMYRQKGLVFFLLFYGLFGAQYSLRKQPEGITQQGLAGSDFDNT